MQPQTNWLFPGTSAESVLKVRPLTAEVFARLGLIDESFETTK